MDLVNSIKIMWSLIAANVAQIFVIIGLAIYIFKIKRQQTYSFYHKNIKRPICRVNVNVQRALRPKRLNVTEDDLFAFHNASFDHSELSDNPYAKTSILSHEMKRKVCKKKIKEIKYKIRDYYVYTNGRIKPEDVFEFLIYRQELSKYEL